MLIFDNFKTRAGAQAFVTAVTEQFELSASVWDSQNAMEEAWFNKVPLATTFPFQLSALIVTVDRTLDETENAVRKLVADFDGTFAGT
jgi:hypothetical protein